MIDPSSSSNPGKTWNVVACPACGGKFKTAQGSGDAEMACPHCGEAVALPAAEEAGFGADEASFGNERLTVPRGDSGGTSSGGERRRRKAVQEQEPAWDRATAAGGGSAPGANDDEDTTEYLTGDPNDPESQRIKRIRRKKNLTGVQKFGRTLLIGTVTVVVLATGIAIALLVKEQVKVVATEAQEQRGLPDKVAELVAQALAAKNDSAILTKDEENACMSIINGFYSADSIEEKLNFVRLPERVKPLLEKAYKDSPLKEDIRVGEIVLSQKLVDKGRRFITLAARIDGSDREFQMFAFEQANDTILMDWEVSSGYQQLPLQQFIAQRISEPTVFRLKVTQSEYYAGIFADKDRYQSVTLTYPGQIDFKLAGYIDRRQSWADALLARLEFEAPSLIVTLRYPPNASSAFEVEVTGVVLDGWFY